MNAMTFKIVSLSCEGSFCSLANLHYALISDCTIGMMGLLQCTKNTSLCLHVASSVTDSSESTDLSAFSQAALAKSCSRHFTGSQSRRSYLLKTQ
jgi:hypothetical protein